MTKQEFFDLLEKYEKGTCTEEERIIFDNFYDRFDKAPGRWDDWDLQTKERIRLEIYAKMRQRIGNPGRSRRLRLSVAWRIAASVALIVGIGYLTYIYTNHAPAVRYLTTTTERGQRVAITLPDGSVVQLNAKSSITFPEKFAGRNRQVSLNGEAFFHVTKNPDKPFIIKSGNLVTTVLGTQFNIQAYPEDPTIKVTVATGKVCVEASSTKDGSDHIPDHSILLPNQQASFDKTSRTLEKREIDLHPYLAWKEGIIVLSKVSLYEAAKILERWYPVEFRFENNSIGQQIISGEFRNDKIGNILENIKFLTGVDYQIKPGNQILLTRNR